MNTRCAQEAGAGAVPDAGGEAADGRGVPAEGITMDDAGTEATLALGVAALPMPRPKLHPAHAATTASAIAADRKAAGNARFGMLSVIPAMLRTIGSSLPPNSALGHETRATPVMRSLVTPYIGDDRGQVAGQLVKRWNSTPPVTLATRLNSPGEHHQRRLKRGVNGEYHAEAILGQRGQNMA